MKAVVGFDTSCYTTSVAAVSIEGEILSSRRRLLRVAQGERGLQQSEGLFQHVSALPGLLQEAMRDIAGCEVAAVCASVRPRPVEDSYMPVFRVGESHARAAASLLRVPFFSASHQEGHIRAARVDSGIAGEAFLALHLSGGTTELLLSRPGELRLLGGSMDLHAGQLVDRVGVRIGLSFPAGPEMERLAMAGKSQGLLKVSMRGIDCSLSGAETQMLRLLDAGSIAPQDAAAEVFSLLARSILRMLLAASERTGVRQALLAGGVASSLHLRTLLQERIAKRRLPLELCFARPEFAGDNAVGIALLGLEQLHKEETEA